MKKELKQDIESVLKTEQVQKIYNTFVDTNENLTKNFKTSQTKRLKKYDKDETMFCYSRVSSDIQLEGTSLTQQKQFGEELSKKLGFDCIQYDEGSKSSNHEEIPNVNNFNVVGTKVMPNYPRRALKLHQEGIIYLKILVSDKGLPEKIIFTQKSKYNLLNKAALEAVSKWKFQPMITNGHKSKMWVNVPIEFKIS